MKKGNEEKLEGWIIRFFSIMKTRGCNEAGQGNIAKSTNVKSLFTRYTDLMTTWLINIDSLVISYSGKGNPVSQLHYKIN